MHEEPVLVAVDGAVATIKLNRPEAGNTINLPLARALLDAAIRTTGSVWPASSMPKLRNASACSKTAAARGWKRRPASLTVAR